MIQNIYIARNRQIVMNQSELEQLVLQTSTNQELQQLFHKILYELDTQKNRLDLFKRYKYNQLGGLREYVLNGGNLSNYPILTLCIQTERDEAASYLLHCKANPNMCNDKKGLTPLMHATKQSNLFIVKELLRHGANTNLTNSKMKLHS